MTRLPISLCLSILTLMVSFRAAAQGSQVIDSLTVPSNILKEEKKFSLYLPPGYATSHRSYPVIYLLHGGGVSPNKHMDWIQQGNMQRMVDEAIARGDISPVIIVMPDAEQTYYLNNVDGNYQFEDFFVEELIPFVEEHYRCRREKQYRGIAGLSMGGFGALLYSLHHPDLFAACAALSAAVRTDEQIRELPLNEYLRRYRRAMGELSENDERITSFWNQNSILYLMERLPEEQKDAVRIYLDIGDDDYLYKGNSLLHILMNEHSIPHEYRVRDGGHRWEYWRSGLPDALKFIGQSF